jgi:predicted O-methyltransferase YrrM
MSRKSLAITPALADYIATHSLREDAVARSLREETSALPMAMMQISPEQGQFMALVARMVGAQRAIEIGTFTGYSALAVARALPEDGTLLCCDVNAEWTAIARRAWEKAGVARKITLVLAPARDTLASRIAAGESGSYDLAFIDADKSNYDSYYESCLALLRPRGVILVDNVLWNGKVADPKAQDADTVAIRALNAKIHTDQRVDAVLLPIGDGVTMVSKR